MTTLHSEEITVLWQCWMGGLSAFRLQWQHCTVKRSCCALTVLMGGLSAFGVCIFIYALVFPYIFLLVDCSEWALIYVIEQWKVLSVLWQFWGVFLTLESQWQHCTVKRSLCALTVLNRGVLSACESQWQHCTVKRSLCALTVLTGGGSICLWCLYLYICTGISLYFPIRWLFLTFSY